MPADSSRDYGQDLELAKQFLREYSYVDDSGEVVPKYHDILTKLANRQEILLTVELADLEKFNATLTAAVVENTTRYVKIFLQALDQILPSYKTMEIETKEVMDVFIEQRTFIAERNQRVQNQGAASSQDNSQFVDKSTPGTVDINGAYPPDLIRRHEVVFKPVSLEPTPIRDILAQHVGRLMSFRGVVVRTTEVKPQISVVCYTCDQCGCETFQCVKGLEFIPLFECTSAVCKANKVQGRLSMQTRGSKLVKFQEIKLQEHTDQVPTGHIPRAITVFAHGELTRRCAPGDHVSVSGIFLTVDGSNNFRMKTGGLVVDTYIEAHYIAKMNKTEDDELNVQPLTQEEATNLARGAPNFLGRLSKSIAPEIYGHQDLKEALLLLLVGGVDKSPNGMRIRGNINICLMGDPGVAKSQLLSFIDRLAPRSQYTTGRGSSGVGLTAAVLKDPITNEMILEGGALVLADEGICCIDEFDKMMDTDRTAIHEVMEQQTVSIAKAGIMTTLNARVSILAAANPAYGRYNAHKSITENLDLPPALLSRFDLLWLIKDHPESANDKRLGNFITSVHQNPDQRITLDEDVIDMKTMRRYIELCKTKHPIIPPELDEKLVDIYLAIRELRRGDDSVDTLFTSPRSLLAIIRMSTAFARLRLSDVVEEADINRAVRLYECSRKSIDEAKAGGDRNCATVLDLLKSLLKNNYCSLAEFMREAGERGYEESVVKQALEKLETIETIKILDNDIIYTC
jgi:DNA replication licensing factor MCM7